MPRPVVPIALLPRLRSRAVEGDVVRQDQRAGFADDDALARGHAAGFELVQLLEQGLGRQHHAVADQALNAVAQHARRDQVQHGFLTIDDERMAGIVPALKADHGCGLIGEQIDDLALALVAPLGADNHDCCCHIACQTSLIIQLPSSLTATRLQC